MKHFLYAIPIGLICGLWAVIATASALEFKDKQWGGEWDWLDWLATVLGGLIGCTIFCGILALVFLL